MANRLPAAIESIIYQSYKNVELIIIDDGSDIDQLKLISHQLEEINAVRLVRNNHAGKPTAVNRGFREVSGKYITILDADDCLPPDSLVQRVTALESENADLCAGSFETCDGQIRRSRRISKIKGLNNSKLTHALLTQVFSPVHQNAMMFSHKLLQKVGGMDPRMKRGQDKDFALRLLKKSRKTVFIDHSVYIYHRYSRPFKVRMYNRFNGIKFKLIITYKYFNGFKRWICLLWAVCIGTAKLMYNIFGVYKR